MNLKPESLLPFALLTLSLSPAANAALGFDYTKFDGTYMANCQGSLDYVKQVVISHQDSRVNIQMLNASGASIYTQSLINIGKDKSVSEQNDPPAREQRTSVTYLTQNGVEQDNTTKTYIALIVLVHTETFHTILSSEDADTGPQVMRANFQQQLGDSDAMKYNCEFSRQQ